MVTEHVTREFQRWTKAEQAAHLREAHGIEPPPAALRRITSRTPAAATLYQLHVSAHDETENARQPAVQCDTLTQSGTKEPHRWTPRPRTASY